MLIETGILAGFLMTPEQFSEPYRARKTSAKQRRKHRRAMRRVARFLLAWGGR